MGVRQRVIGEFDFRKAFFFFVLFCGYNLRGGELELDELLRRTGARLRWEPYRKVGDLVLRDKKVTFRPGASWLILDHERVVSGEVLLKEGGNLLFTRDAVTAIFTHFKIEDDDKKKVYRVTIILIDPGHGGRDPGALGIIEENGRMRVVKEKDIALVVSLKLEQKLKKSYPDKKIFLTRRSDVYPTLEERVALANSFKQSAHEGMIYLSIHVNASLNKSASGYEVWYLPEDYRRRILRRGGREDLSNILNTLWEEEFAIEGTKLADFLLQGIERQVGPFVQNRGLKAESWFVVRNARMASVLVELGFITNREEVRKLVTTRYQERLAVGLHEGIEDFVNFFEKERGRE